MMTFKNFAVFTIMMVSAAVFFASCSSASKDEPKAPVAKQQNKTSNTSSASSSANGLSANIHFQTYVLDPKNELTADQRAELETMFKAESTRVMTNESEDAIYDASVGITKSVFRNMKQYAASHAALKNTEVSVFCKVTVTYTSAKKGDDLNRESDIHFRQLDMINF